MIVDAAAMIGIISNRAMLSGNQKMSVAKCRGSWVVGRCRGSWVWVNVVGKNKIILEKFMKKNINCLKTQCIDHN